MTAPSLWPPLVTLSWREENCLAGSSSLFLGQKPENCCSAPGRGRLLPVWGLPRAGEEPQAAFLSPAPFSRGTHVHTFCKQTRVFPKPLEPRSNQPAARLLIRLYQKLFLCLRLPLQRNDRLHFCVLPGYLCQRNGGKSCSREENVRAGGCHCAM